MAVAKQSMRPETVEPSFAVVMKISPDGPVLIEPNGQIPLIPANVKVVHDGFAFVGQASADGLPRRYTDGIDNCRRISHC